MSKPVPKFIPRPDQIDFTHARYAPVINSVVKYNDRILIVRRNEGMKLYPGYWNGISGFLDDAKTITEKVQEELHEEVGIGPDQIQTVTLGGIFHQHDDRYQKTWIVHPVLVTVSTDDVVLNWEAEEYVWIARDQVSEYNLLPGFINTLETFLL
jgi:8-oxo-dGTP pyrophosphatase MutT (NUDIX family)